MKRPCRSRYLVLVFIAVTLGGVTLPAAGQSLRVEAVVELGEPEVFTAILYNQLDSPAGVGISSQRFEAANSAFDCRAADDFEVPAADVEWQVESMRVLGAYFGGPGPTPLIDVEFFADSAGQPGAAVCSYIGLVAGVDFQDDGVGGLDVDLPSSCDLPAGLYWLSVRADMDSATGGQWLWQERSVQVGAGFVWENPGDGFGTGCVSWTPAGSCGASAPDLLFLLAGEEVPVDLQSIVID